MARNSKRRLSISEETVHGTTNSNPTQLVLEHDDRTSSPVTPKAQSAIVRTDARIKESIALNRSANFAYSSELVYPTVNQGQWAAMRSSLNSAEVAAATFSGCSMTTGATPTITKGGETWAGVAVGDIIKTSGAAAAGDNRYVIVVTVVTGTLTVQIPDAGTFSAVNTGNITVTRGARMTDNTATTERAFTAEEAWLDVQQMLVYTGQVASSTRLGFSMGRPSTIGIDFVGRDVTASAMASATVGITGASYTAPTELPVFGPARSILVIVNGISYPVSTLGINWSRNARTRHSTSGGATPDGVPCGMFTCSVSASLYYAIATLISQASAGTNVPVWFVMEDGGGKALAFSMGTVMWDTAMVGGGGPNSDAMVSVSGAATNNSTRDACVSMFRFE